MSRVTWGGSLYGWLDDDGPEQPQQVQAYAPPPQMFEFRCPAPGCAYHAVAPEALLRNIVAAHQAGHTTTSPAQPALNQPAAAPRPEPARRIEDPTVQTLRYNPITKAYE